MALFPLVFTAKAPKLTSSLPLAKMFSSEVLTVYCDNDEEAKLVAKGVKLLVSMEVKQGRLSRLILDPCSLSRKPIYCNTQAIGTTCQFIGFV